MPQLDGVRIVALSGYGGEAERRRSEAAGLDGHLIKPVDLAALQTLLASL
jgi:CheY-like chemotaxis protein